MSALTTLPTPAHVDVEPGADVFNDGLTDASESVSAVSRATLSPILPMLSAFEADQSLDLVATEPEVKKPRKEKKGSIYDSEEKEKRLNRVGLSYRCGRCGQPKKGHVCGLVTATAVTTAIAIAASADDVEKSEATNGIATTVTAVTAQLKSSEGKKTKSPEASDITDGPHVTPDSILKDIQSVLETPPGVVSAPKKKRSGARGGTDVKTSGGTKRGRAGSSAKKGSMPPVVGVEEEESELGVAIYEELDVAMQRPPSLITPDDGETVRAGAGLSSFGLAPSSLLSSCSASGMFSPGQLMNLLGTPTPAITPGQSPGTLWAR